MTWLDWAPTLGAALVVLLLPGLVVAMVAGVRGVLLAALAPAGSVAVVSGAAVIAGLLGVGFGWIPVLATTGVAALLVALARWVGGLRTSTGSPRSRADRKVDVAQERRGLVAGVLGAVVGGVALGLGLARGVGSPDAWPQTFDAVFHLSAVEHIVASGDASSLTLGTLSSPSLAHVFYPAAWHDLAALVAMLTGASVPAAANAVAIAAAAVAWPLGCAGLARVAVGPRPSIIAAAGVLSAGMTASPVVLSSYGTLWPNALATALLPAVFALVVDLVGAGRVRAVPVVPGCVLLVGGLGGLSLAHPNVSVALVVLAVPAIVGGTWSRGVRWRMGSVAYGVFVTWLVALSPAFDGQRGTSWPKRQSISQALGEWIALSPQRLPVPYVFVALSLVGCVVAWRNPRLRWLVATHATAGGLFVLVAGSDGRLSRMVSAAWWDDPYRLAALAGLAGVPLAAIGLDALARALVRFVPTGAGAVRTAYALTGASLAAAVVVAGLAVGQTATVVSWWYAPQTMVQPAERALLERLPDYVTAGEKVIGNPWDGAALTGPLGEREAVFPHLTGSWDPDRKLLAQSLAGVSARPDVCAALDRLDVKYVLTNTERFWLDDARRKIYAGLDVAGRDGFHEVAHGGGATLWQVTACGT